MTRRSTAGGSGDDSAGEERSPSFQEAGPPPEAVFEIEVVDGAEGQALAEVQARVLWEVTKWQLSQSRCEDGRRPTA